jgi:hypothetical protein
MAASTTDEQASGLVAAEARKRMAHEAAVNQDIVAPGWKIGVANCIWGKMGDWFWDIILPVTANLSDSMFWKAAKSGEIIEWIKEASDDEDLPRSELLKDAAKIVAIREVVKNMMGSGTWEHIGAVTEDIASLKASACEDIRVIAMLAEQLLKERCGLAFPT